MKFEDKETHLQALAEEFYANLEYDSSCEYGSIGLDPKRPFGNSDVESDILDIIGEQPEGNDGYGPCWSSDQREYAADLYREELIPYLQIKWREHEG